MLIGEAPGAVVVVDREVRAGNAVIVIGLVDERDRLLLRFDKTQIPYPDLGGIGRARGKRRIERREEGEDKRELRWAGSEEGKSHRLGTRIHQIIAATFSFPVGSRALPRAA